MAITTVQYKASIEAKIAAATGSTSLDDLTLIKSNADLWLKNNSGGSITGYSSLEALIQTKQNALTGSSTLDDITLTGVSAFPPTQLTALANYFLSATSSSWTSTVNGIIKLRATGGGGAGGGATRVAQPAGGGGGSASSTCEVELLVRIGDALSWTIGAGGVGGPGVIGSDGGATTVRLNGVPVLVVRGGIGGGPGSNVAGAAAIYRASPAFSREVPQIVIGGDGAPGALATDYGGSAAPPGGKTRLKNFDTTEQPFADPSSPIGGPGGTAGALVGPGGGGGASVYGPGGPGGNGLNVSTSSNPGGNAPSTSYGAGGGGSSGVQSARPADISGGNGAAGCVEVFY